MDFPARLRELRKRAGLTQEGLAESMGWSGQSQVSNYENGRGDPSFSELPALASALGVGVPELFADPGTNSSRGSHFARMDGHMLASSIEALRRVSKNLGLPYDPVTHPEATAAAYELSLALGSSPSQSQVIDFATSVAALLSRHPEGDDDGREVGSTAGGNHRSRVDRKART